MCLIWLGGELESAVVLSRSSAPARLHLVRRVGVVNT
jgi:hypothetical protein